ncbi:DUF4271 domain-containing protein [Arenibacter sp. GZD96]|uniref:DUF4271 domain-containing protein n=1 Tax=Aurantibrevibacter litoralis TaxID=3106030 RepID=UPI002AFFB23E|nr:DUF4271 domain-containing protein [Arenibacter sp. GZD-96]MEA1787170.1 DUF4271 domain-containing protein [Arenibacter sp. GZD-96]
MEPLLRPVAHPDWITLLLVISLVFITVAKGLFYQKFMNFVILPFNNKYIFMYNKKDTLFNGFNLFMSLFQLFNFALYLYFAFTIFADATTPATVAHYFSILLLLFLFLLLKVGLQLFNANIFDWEKPTVDIIFKKLSYLNYSSILMCAANILYSFVPMDPKVVFYLSLFLIILINVVGWITLLRNYQKLILSRFFYFILYLCALEIAPLIIIGSYLKD